MKNHDNKLRSTSPPFSYQNYYFVAAAIASAIAGLVHILMPLVFAHGILHRAPVAIFFLGSGIAQLFWIVPMIRQWGRPWYYVGIVGNIAFIALYMVTRVPGNPVSGRGGDVDVVAMVCELAQVAYIAITIIILRKLRTTKTKYSRKEHAR